MRFRRTISLNVSFALCLTLWFCSAHAESIRLLIRSSPLAGSQYYALAQVRDDIKVGDRVDLIREPDNRHDAQAVRIEWRGHRLGYLPRAHNRAIAAAMDSGEKLVARVSSLDDNKNPWLRMAVEVFVEL